MAAPIVCDPATASFPPGGGTVKLRLNNKTTKKYMIQVELSDPTNYVTNLPATDMMATGDSRLFEIQKKPAGAGGTLKITYYDILPASKGGEMVCQEAGKIEVKLT
ncbi:unnamed protein product, partial [Mesorhabditis spiculigera]